MNKFFACCVWLVVLTTFLIVKIKSQSTDENFFGEALTNDESSPVETTNEQSTVEETSSITDDTALEEISTTEDSNTHYLTTSELSSTVADTVPEESSTQDSTTSTDDTTTTTTTTTAKSTTKTKKRKLASDKEIIARTICREAFEQDTAAYDAVAWVIYNRVKSPSFPNNGKSVCLQNGQFAVWRDYWGKTDIPSGSKTTKHKDYPYCLKLAENINSDKPPTALDPTNNALFFLTDSPSAQKNHPGGTTIGGNYFFQKW